MGRIKGRRAEDTRQQVVDGAAEAFARHGYEGARVSDIAAVAGVSSGAMDNHFGSKADLLAAVVERHACDQLDAWAEGDTSGGLLAMVQEHGAQLVEPQPGSALLVEVVAAARRHPEVLAILTHEAGSREEVLAQAIAAGQEVDEVDPALDPHAVARFMFTVVLGAAVAQEAALPAVPADAWTTLLDRVIAALRPEERP
ncbi:MAG: TetR family transcriptional regulator [Acidimicrobiales bacterium]